MVNYKKLVEELPAPQTKEEQYIYALVRSVADEDYKANVSDSPFWRTEQYWRAFYVVMKDRLKDFLSTTPKEGEVDTAAIQNHSVSTNKLTLQVESRLLGEGRITEEMLAQDIAEKLLASGRITEDMLVDALANKLLGDGRVTAEMLSSTVISKLLGPNKVIYGYLDANLQSKIDKIK